MKFMRTQLIIIMKKRRIMGRGFYPLKGLVFTAIPSPKNKIFFT